jgi:hypothetical protein
VVKVSPSLGEREGIIYRAPSFAILVDIDILMMPAESSGEALSRVETKARFIMNGVDCKKPSRNPD